MRPADEPSRSPHLRHPHVEDGAALWDLARDCGLDLNSPYAYLLLAHDFAETCLVAEAEGRLVGFVTGYRPPERPDVVFVWQVGVAPDARGRGLGLALVDALVERTRTHGVRYLEASVTPSNDTSWRLFESVATRRGADIVKASLFDAALFPDGDHEEELLVRIGPFGPPARAPAPDAT